MCGIVGYTGPGDACAIVLSGLRKLEYRGYDSAGMALLDGQRLHVVRAVGRVAALAAKAAELWAGLAAPDSAGANARATAIHTGIGHTRWATHGRPNELNAHPHRDLSGRIAVVHNGIIENYAALRQELSAGGASFLSETDTEVAAVLIGKLYNGDLVAAVEQAVERLEGTFAFAVLSLDHAGLLVGARRGSPLALGVDEASGGMFLASDAVPIIAHTRKVMYLDDDQVVALQPGKVELRQWAGRGTGVSPVSTTGTVVVPVGTWRELPARLHEIHWSEADVERGGFPHFMLKEIHEQPGALRRLASALVASPGFVPAVSSASDAGPSGNTGLPPERAFVTDAARAAVAVPIKASPAPPGEVTPPSFHLESMPLAEDELRRISRLVIVAQGTAFHAGLVGRNMIERTARIPVSVEYGSDFRYRDPVIDPSVLVIAISQSGETADTLGAVRVARQRGCKTLSIINAVGSTIARESDGVVYMQAGPEVGVASTKAFTCQIAALYVLAIHLGMVRGMLTPAEAVRRVEDLLLVPGRVEEVLARADQVEAVALKYKDATNALFMGRGTGFPLALEGALKLKEISYIHAEGYDAAEMKHGPIALIDEKMPVVVLALQGRRYGKIVSNIQEVKARGGRVIAIASHDDNAIQDKVDDVLRVHDDRGIMNSVVCAVPLQLFAYYIAVARGCDVDKPRNLAKSVTVE